MKLLFLCLFIPTISLASIIKAGNFFGTGSFSCFFINSKIQRPLSSHWQIRAIDSNEESFEFIGNYPIVNSQPIYFSARLEQKTLDSENYLLFNELGQKRGKLQCQNDMCKMKFKFKANLMKNIRTFETIKTEWRWENNSFVEKVRLAYNYIPLLGTCNANSSYLKTE